MARRITIPVLGGTMAPYGSHAPALQTGNVSENWHLDVDWQIGRGVDTTAAMQLQFPFALSKVRITNTFTTVPNHSKAQIVYLSITSAALDALSNTGN